MNKICKKCGSNNLEPIMKNNGFDENPMIEEVGNKCRDCGKKQYD